MFVVITDELARLLDLSLRAPEPTVDDDWSVPAGDLEWSCWSTLDHTIDCLFSYVMQLASEAHAGFLPFNELHAQPDARPVDLLAGLRGVGTMLVAVARDAAPGATASDGVLPLDLADWCARGAYELVLHTDDVLAGLGARWDVPTELCQSILESPALWMVDRSRAAEAEDGWHSLILGSGRRLRD